MRVAQLEAAARQARQRRILTIVGTAVIVALIAAIGFVVVKAMGGDDGKQGNPVTGDVVPPKNLDDSGAFIVGQADAPVTVEVYYDYMCPACGAMEQANGDELDRLMNDGTIRIAMRPISFLDRQSQGTQYSTRAANAFATVVNDDPDHAWAFHMALYASQPEEGSEGLSDGEIKDIATSAGVPSDVADTFTDNTYEQWVADTTKKAFDSGIQGTPTVKIDGEVFDGDVYSKGPLTAAIESAAAGK
ncbi:MAG: DsbA family protein [Nocardioidaceae bacterium]